MKTKMFYLKPFKKILFYFALVTFFSTNVIAQPSGGPYGPIHQFYQLPEITGTIYYVSPNGNADESGKNLNNPTTIEEALKKVKTGDAIILRGGIYRTGNLVFNQGITIQPYADEKPVFKGTYVAKEWQNLHNGLWRTSWEHLFPSEPDSWWRKEREGSITPLHKFNNDMVFVDGKFLHSTGWQGDITPDTFYIDYKDKQVYIGFDPTDKEVEITAFNSALVRTTNPVHGKTSDKKGPTIKGVTFTQYAYRALEIEGYFPEGVAKESEFGKDVVGTTIENCTISYCSRVAAYLRGDHLTLKNCKISDTSTEGIYILSSNDVLLEKNIFTRNNIEQITGYYPAAVKIFNQTHRVVCNDNLIVDLPYSNGVWYDVGNIDGVFTNNWVENVGIYTDPFHEKNVWPSQNGFFFEISKGAVCTGNVFVNCDHGILILNSSNVKVYNNTFVNSMACFGRNERSAQGDHFGWHPSTGPDVDERINHEFVNNLLASTDAFNRPLLFVWQPNSLCERLNVPTFSKLDYNVFSTENKTPPVIWLSQKLGNSCQTSFNTTSELNKLKGDFSKNSITFRDYTGPLFKGFHLKNYHLLSNFKGIKSGTEIPQKIKELSGNKSTQPYVGAYPFK